VTQSVDKPLDQRINLSSQYKKADSSNQSLKKHHMANRMTEKELDDKIKNTFMWSLGKSQDKTT
jgi:hypothetical protein